MRKNYSTCIIPENTEQLLFSIIAGSYLFHCWKHKEKNCYVVIKESNDTRNVVPNQILNFNLKELKRYLYTITNQLKELDGFLYLSKALWTC